MRETSNKVQESWLLWYGHVLRREEEYYVVGKSVMVTEMPGEKKEVGCHQERLVGERTGGSTIPG